MNFLKKRLKRKKGYHFIYPCILLLFCSMLYAYIYYQEVVKYTHDTVDDGLTASSLAASCINIKQELDFNASSQDAVNNCYSIFLTSLKENLHLDDFLYPIENSGMDILITSAVNIDSFVFYRVEKTPNPSYRGGPNEKEFLYLVYKTTYNGHINEYLGEAGTVKTPNGNIVTTDTIYTKITFDITRIY